MGWSGGVYSRVHNWVADALAAINIEAVRMDEEDDSIATGLNNCITKDGTNSPSADLPMATRKHTNVSSPTARSQYLDVNTFQDGEPLWGGTSGGDADDFTLALSPVITSYVTGMLVRWNPHADCNVGATINIDTIGARDLYVNGREIRAGEIKSIGYYEMIYDGVDFHIIGAAPMDAVNRGDFITMGQVVDGDGVWCGSSAGTSAAYTLNPEPNVEAYVAGMSLKFEAHLDCSDDATINVDGTGAKDLYVNGRNVRADEILIDRLYEIVYDGVRFHIINASPSDSVLSSDFLTLNQRQLGTGIYGGNTGGTNTAFTLGLAPELVGAYPAGMTIRFRIHTDCGDDPTLDIDGQGADDIWINGAAAKAGDLVQYALYEVIHDGGQWHAIGGSVAADQLGHGASIYSTTPNNINDGAAAELYCQSEFYDTDSLHSASSQNFNFPSNLYGLWSLSATITMNPTGTASGPVKFSILDKNDVILGASQIEFGSSIDQILSISGRINVDGANNEAHLEVENESGVIISVTVDRFSCHFDGHV